MKRKTITAISAAVMLGISSVTVAVPVASADVIGSAGKLGDGKYIAPGDVENATRTYTTYNSDGTIAGEWPMELRRRGTSVDASGEPIWDWWTVTQRGGTTTPYSFEWEAISVMDAKLQTPSTNGFLQNFASNSVDSIGGAMNHFVSANGQTASWRMLKRPGFCSASFTIPC